jgi:hypothetical protein
MNGSTAGGSLFYRKNADAIQRGKVPEKYTRLLPYIPGKRILEFGAAEGVQAMLLAERGCEVTALEVNRERHEGALRLKDRWLELGRRVQTCTMVHGDIRERLDLLDGMDTMLAVRTIYHLRGDAIAVMTRAAAAGIENVVLCGNKNRAHRFEAGQTPHDDGLGEWNRLSSIAGMTDLLEKSGFQIETVVAEGDPIVTGRCR